MVTIEKMTAKQLFARPDWGRFEAEYLAMAYPEMAGPGVLRSYYEQCTDSGAATLLVAADGERTLGLACFFVTVSPHTGVKTCMVDALYTSELAPPPPVDGSPADACASQGGESGGSDGCAFFSSNRQRL